METFFKAVGVGVVALLVVALISTLGAYPTKWLVNYLFTPSTLLTVFGVSKFGFWKALAFNMFVGMFSKPSTSNKN